LGSPQVKAPLHNVTPERRLLLKQMAKQLTPEILLAHVQRRGQDFTLTDTALLPTGNPDNNQPAEPAVAQQVSPAKDQPSPQPSSANNSRSQLPQQPMAQNYRKGGILQQNFNPNASQEQQRNDAEYLGRLTVRADSQKDVQNRQQLDPWSVAAGNTIRNGEGLFSPHSMRPSRTQQTEVNLGPMVPLWLTTEA